MRAESELGWIAGILDGEGTIGLNKGKTTRVNRGFVWSPKLVIDNTNKGIVESVQRILGIGRITRIRAGTWGQQKPLFRYQVFSYRDMINLLSIVRPYLIGKARQADFLSEAVNLLLDIKGARTNPARSQIRDRRLDTIWRELRYLNAKRNQVIAAKALLDSAPLYTRQQYEADMKAFKESYNPKWKTLTYNRERLRQWRLLNPEEYEAQLERAAQTRREKGKRDLATRRALIQQTASSLKSEE